MPPPVHDPARCLQPSLEVATVWSSGGSQNHEKQKDLDSEPGSATRHLCGQRARWQPRPGQWVRVTGAEDGEGAWGERRGSLDGVPGSASPRPPASSWGEQLVRWLGTLRLGLRWAGLCRGAEC